MLQQEANRKTVKTNSHFNFFSIENVQADRDEQMAHISMIFSATQLSNYIAINTEMTSK